MVVLVGRVVVADAVFGRTVETRVAALLEGTDAESSTRSTTTCVTA
jgi:hypothetical protein